MKLREQTTDEQMLAQVKYYKWMTVEGKQVLDVGASFGTFTQHAYKQGASHILSFEPDITNFRLLKANTRRYKPVQVVQGAVVASEDKEVTLWSAPSGKNPNSSSIFRYAGRAETTVPAHNFSTLLKKFKPDTIKMRCEGAEYELLETELPQSVKQITVVFHFHSPEGTTPPWFEQMQEVVKQFTSWKCIKSPKLNPKLWYTVGAWER